MLVTKWNRSSFAWGGLLAIVSLLSGSGPQGLSNAAAQNKRPEATTIVSNQRGITSNESANLAAKLSQLPDAIAGQRPVEEYAGSLDAQLMQAAFGFDPMAVGESMLGPNNQKQERTLTFDEIAKLPPIEKRYDPNYGTEAGIETICGADSRTRIYNTTSTPWRWNCKLIMYFPDGVYVGSGWMVGPHHVITAGHCVHGGGSGGQWATRIDVIPAMNGTTRPYGTAYASRLYSVLGWTRDRNANYDYGAIILSSNVGYRTGWFGYANYSSYQLAGSTINTAGYPADKANGTQWFGYGSVSSLTGQQLRYYIDTYGGQSGSAVWWLLSGSRYAVGIHAYGGCPNAATRINGSVYNFISNIKTR